jgi:hypothetical protein
MGIYPICANLQTTHSFSSSAGPAPHPSGVSSLVDHDPRPCNWNVFQYTYLHSLQLLLRLCLLVQDTSLLPVGTSVLVTWTGWLTSALQNA